MEKLPISRTHKKAEKTYSSLVKKGKAVTIFRFAIKLVKEAV